METYREDILKRPGVTKIPVYELKPAAEQLFSQSHGELVLVRVMEL